jgi:hypothetical protein
MFGQFQRVIRVNASMMYNKHAYVLLLYVIWSASFDGADGTDGADGADGSSLWVSLADMPFDLLHTAAVLMVLMVLMVLN